MIVLPGLNQKLKVGWAELTYNSHSNIEKELQEVLDLVILTGEMTDYDIHMWNSAHIEHGGHLVLPFQKGNDEWIKIIFLVTQGFKLRATKVLNFHGTPGIRDEIHRRAPELKADQLLVRLKKLVNEF